MKEQIEKLIKEYEGRMKQPHYSDDFHRDYAEGYESGRDSTCESIIEDLKMLKRRFQRQEV